MSGPWDRPSHERDAYEPDEAGAEQPDTTRASGDAWSERDPWAGERREAGSSWDDWSTLPPPDDFVLDEPTPTLGDPWAESWVAEEPAEPRVEAPSAPEPPPSDAPEPDRWPAPQAEPDRWPAPQSEPDRWAAPQAEPEPWPGTDVPADAGWQAPASDASAWSAEPEVVDEAPAPPTEPTWNQGFEEPAPPVPQPPFASSGPVEPADVAAPIVAPWQASDDPWASIAEPAAEATAEPVEAVAEPAEAPESIADEPEAAADEPEPASETVTEPQEADVADAPQAVVADAPQAGVADAPQPDAAEPETEAEAEPEPEPEPASTGGWRRDLLPAWLTGRRSEPRSEPEEPEPPTVEAAEPPAAPEPEPVAPAEAAGEWPQADAVADAELAEPAAPETASRSAEPDVPDAAAPDAWASTAEAAEEIESIPAPSQSDEATGTWPAADIGLEPDEPTTPAEPGDRRFDAWIGNEASAPAAEGGAEVDDVAGAPPEAEPVWSAEPVAWSADLDMPATPETAEPPLAEADAEPAADAAAPEPPEVGEPAPPADEERGSSWFRPPPDGQPTWRPDWLPDLDEAKEEEHTRVLPTDWTPPPPSPISLQQTFAHNDELAPHATPARTRPAADVERELEEEAEPGASTAEQAVPWLIGFILLLAGMVIVLLALIFAGDGSLGGGAPTSPSPSLAVAVATATPQATPQPSRAASPSAGASAPASAAPSQDATGGPQYGPLEMVYQGRAAALAPIYLLRQEFTTEAEPAVLAQDPNLDVRRFAWSMDGTRGAGLYADLLVSVEPSAEKRQLAEDIATITFGRDASTVYAVRITQDGANDVAAVIAIDYESGDTSELARVTYPRPPVQNRVALREAQFQDEGGAARLFWMEDNRLRLYVVNGGMWEISPEDGTVTEVERRPPLLVSPDGRQRIVVTEDGGTTTLTRLDMDGVERASTTVEGVVSHVRWSPDAKRIVFTLGRSASGGGVLQDLFLWDLAEEPPTQITATGAAFGAEWLGGRVRWREDPGEA